MKSFIDRFGFYFCVLFCIVVYLCLAFKNPFSDNSLIANLEPYPDTLLYSFPAWNWVRGNGWNLGVSEKIIDITVPNIYGYFLVPFFKIFGDIRSFYFTNIIFGLGTIIFFELALKNILSKKKWYIVGFFGFLLATNFYFFNQPQLVMAENVNYFLISVFLYLLSLKFKWTELIPMGILITITLLLKNTNLVLGGSFMLAFFIKIFWEKFHFANIKKMLMVGVVFGLLMAIFYLPKFFSLNNSEFSLNNLTNNFGFYFSCLSGGECRNLWYWQRLISWDIVVMFLLGVITMFFDKNKKWLLLELISPLILLVLAMSFFKYTEGRHVEILLPIMLVIGAVAVDKLLNKFKWPAVFICFFLLINVFLTSYQFDNQEKKIVSLKKQVGLNFRHREDPWNYLCLKMVQDFMVDKKEAYFGSFLPMYFFDAYNVKLNYLPLADDQDYMSRGLIKYFPVPLENLYSKKLNEGKEIYLSDYYASNGREAWRDQWNQIVANKKLEKVYQSPLDNCNIYKLSLEK